MGFVVIGRNEGPRLRASLESIRDHVELFVYVDSGSTDGSVRIAEEVGAVIVRLEPDIPFSAARARNAGFERLCECCEDLHYVQFVDGDCVLDSDWPDRAVEVFESDVEVVAVCGRRRESFAGASVFNRICDVEWRLPPRGEAAVFGGEVAIRVGALSQVGGYDAELVACEDEELAMRLRASGGKIVRLEATSSYHDAAMYRLSEWWLRAVRWGHGIAQVSAIHGGPSSDHYAQAKRRTWLFGGGLPVAMLGFAVPTYGLSFTLLLFYVLQFHRLTVETRRRGIGDDARLWSLSCVAGQFPNLAGMLLYYCRRWFGSGPRIVEYKRRSGSS